MRHMCHVAENPDAITSERVLFFQEETEVGLHQLQRLYPAL